MILVQNMSNQKIQFCPECDNKFYHQLVDLDDNNKEILVYICRVCGNKDDQINGACVLNIQYDNSASNNNYEHVVNKYTKYDPTLPHISIPCPNEECSSNKANRVSNQTAPSTDALYIRYDNDNMKHVYMCTSCDFIWKTHEP